MPWSSAPASSPGQEKQVWDYYRNNPQMLAQLRAPIFEDKVVDFILELAKVTEKKVTREELFKDDDADKADGGRRVFPRGGRRPWSPVGPAVT